MTTRDHQARAIARSTRTLMKAAGARLAGKQRGADPHVLRNSYDVEDPRAKPWVPIGKGTKGEGLAHREALLQVAEEQRHQHWRDHPHTKVREARERRAVVAAELAAIDAGATSPVGRAATLRTELAKILQLLEIARAAIRRIDITILAALIKRVDFATGRLFPTIDTVAADAGVHRNSVIGALARLKAHGFVTWVRRSIATGNDHEFAPQREQTSNAYYFDHRRTMASRTWQRFLQLLTVKARRLGATPPSVAPADPSTPRSDPSGLYAALASLGASLTNAST